MSKMNAAVWFSVMLVLATGRPVQAEQGKLLNKQEIKALIETANTPEEHRRIVEHYDAQAALLESKARAHEKSGASYKAYARSGGVPNKGAAIAASWRAAEHCEDVAKQLYRAAQEERSLAADHRRQATLDRPK
jgi:hypothetical protein